MVKLVVLGGSAVATPELIDVLCHLPDRTQPMQIVLYARRSDRLERVAGVAALMAKSDTLIDLTWTTDLTGALSGADLVLDCS